MQLFREILVHYFHSPPILSIVPLIVFSPEELLSFPRRIYCIVSQITKEILNNGIFFPFQPDNANMLLLSIVFCRIQALFLSAGSHSWSLCFQSCSIHLLFLSAGWQSCSLRFQYSPIYLLSLSLLGHIHVLFTSDTVLHISICYSFLLGHFTVLFTSNTVLYPFAIPFCSVTFMFSSLPIQSYIYVLFLSVMGHIMFSSLLSQLLPFGVIYSLRFELSFRSSSVPVFYILIKCCPIRLYIPGISYNFCFFPIILHLILYPGKMLSYPSIYPWHII